MVHLEIGGFHARRTSDIFGGKNTYRTPYLPMIQQVAHAIYEISRI
jgi:hypothetical protein